MARGLLGNFIVLRRRKLQFLTNTTCLQCRVTVFNPPQMLAPPLVVLRFFLEFKSVLSSTVE